MGIAQQPENEKRPATAWDSAAQEAADTFAKNGKAIVKSGLTLVLDRLRLAKKYDEHIRTAIQLIDEAPELRAAQKKELIDALKHTAVMDTGKVLSIVTEVLNRLEEVQQTQKDEESKQTKEVIVSLEKKVEQWAQ